MIPGPKSYYRTDEVPDVWFEPGEVWEIRGADLTLSPVSGSHPGLPLENWGAGVLGAACGGAGGGLSALLGWEGEGFPAVAAALLPGQVCSAVLYPCLLPRS